MERCKDPRTDIVATRQAIKTSALLVSAVLLWFGNSSLTLPELADSEKRLADILEELDASKKKIVKYESANFCKKCGEIMWQPCV